MKTGLFILLCSLIAVSGFAQKTYRLAPPMLHVEPVLFQDSALVTVNFGRSDVDVMLECNGIKTAYSGPFYVKENTTIKAVVTSPAFETSVPVWAQALQGNTSKLQWIEQPACSDKYPDSGDELTDQKRANPDYLHAGWVGYNSEEIRYRFRTEGLISKIGFTYLHYPGAWIIAPASYRLIGKTNGKVVANFVRNITVPKEGLGSGLEHAFCFAEANKIGKDQSIEWELVLQAGTLGPDHPGAGSKGWVFIDELMVYE